MRKEYHVEPDLRLAEAHFRKNVFFHRDENGQPKWKDTYVYALLNEEHQE